MSRAKRWRKQSKRRGNYPESLLFKLLGYSASMLIGTVYTINKNSKTTTKK